MSINKYDSAGFANRLREKFPTLYGSTVWTDDEINENWIQSHPEDIAHLSQEAQNKYLDYDVASGHYAYKHTATQAVMDDSYTDTPSAFIARIVHGLKQFPAMMLEGALGAPNSLRESIRWYDEQVRKGSLKGGSQLGVGSKFIRDEPYRYEPSATDSHTLSSYLSDYAPVEENDTSKYISNIAKELNINPDTRLSEVDVQDLKGAIAKYEGFFREPQMVEDPSRPGEEWATLQKL